MTKASSYSRNFAVAQTELNLSGELKPNRRAVVQIAFVVRGGAAPNTYATAPPRVRPRLRR